jgi:hypothetical protein
MSKRPDSLILVYDGKSGVPAMLLDVVKKAVGHEECPLCEITYGPLGRKRAWTECASSIRIPVKELHRDELPPGWNVTTLPCVLSRVGEEMPSVLVAREEIVACNGDPVRLQSKILAALEGAHRCRQEDRGG